MTLQWEDWWPHPHEKTYVCLHVFEGTRAALYVTRADGDWCFLCGGEHPQRGDQYRIVGLHHLIDADDRLAEVLDLRPGEEAERSSAHGEWVRNVIESY